MRSLTAEFLDTESKMTKPPIDPATIRYIKLGRAGRLEKYCIENKVCYLGFGTGDNLVFDQACKAADLNADNEWQALREILFEIESDRDDQARKMAATLAANQIKSFYTAGNETLWITFYSGKLYYAFLDPLVPPSRSPENGGSFRAVNGEWMCTDSFGRKLLIDKLSGQVTKTQLFRGTSCELLAGPAGYLVRRINGIQHSYITKIENARLDLELGLEEAIQSLTPHDFEQLVDLIFSRSLRRVSSVGKVQKFVDIVYEDPLGGSNASNTVCVQVKSETTVSEFEKYLGDPQRKTYDSFYYVYHKSVDLKETHRMPEDCERTVKILGVSGLANLAVEAGLISWIVNKAG